MGLTMCFSGGSVNAPFTSFSGGCSGPEPPEPRPHKWELVSVRVLGFGYSVLEVLYPGCTTFGGRKLLLCRGLPKEDEPLDPHLLGGEHPVIARFEPNEMGLLLAMECIKSLTVV